MFLTIWYGKWLWGDFFLLKNSQEVFDIYKQACRTIPDDSFLVHSTQYTIRVHFTSEAHLAFKPCVLYAFYVEFKLIKFIHHLWLYSTWHFMAWWCSYMYKIDDVQILDFAIEYVNEALRSLNLKRCIVFNHLLMQVANNLHF